MTEKNWKEMKIIIKKVVGKSIEIKKIIKRIERS